MLSSTTYMLVKRNSFLREWEEKKRQTFIEELVCAKTAESDLHVTSLFLATLLSETYFGPHSKWITGNHQENPHSEV